MDSIGAVVAAIVLAALLVGGAAVAQLSFEDTGIQETELTETFDAGPAGDIIHFNASDENGVLFYSETVTVVDKNGKEYIELQDYRWIEDNGTLEVLDGDLANTDQNEITYSYRTPSEEQDTVANALALLFNNAMWLPLVLIVLLVIIAAGMLGGLS